MGTIVNNAYRCEQLYTVLTVGTIVHIVDIAGSGNMLLDIISV